MFNLKKKKPKDLKNIKTNEVSYVDNPANGQPFLFFKSLGRKPNPLEKMLQDLAEEVDVAVFQKMENALSQLQGIDDDQASALQDLILFAADETELIRKCCDSIADFVLIAGSPEYGQETLTSAVEKLDSLSEDEKDAALQLVKLDWSEVALWPSITARQSAAVDAQEEPVGIAKSSGDELWPSITNRQSVVDTQREVVSVAKSNLLWPSITNRGSAGDDADDYEYEIENAGLIWPSFQVV